MPALGCHQNLDCAKYVMKKKIEDEFHFIFECKQYEHERFLWLNKLKKPVNFLQQTVDKKLEIILNEANNVKVTAQYIIYIFGSRSKVVNNLPVTSPNTLFHLLP